MSDERVTEQLRLYADVLERQAGLPLRADTERSRLEAPPTEHAQPATADGGTGGGRRWSSIRWPRPAFAALTAVVVLAIVVVVVVTLRPESEPAALFTQASDPEGALFVLPDDDAGYVLSGGIVDSTSVGASAGTERVWIGTPDDSGSTYRDVVQVCVSRVAAECTSMSSPDFVRDRIEVDGRFLSVSSSSDRSVVVVADQRELLHVAVRGGGGRDPIELATLLTEVDIGDDGSPSVAVDDPHVVFATQASVERIDTDRLHTTSFRVDGTAGAGEIAVSTVTGTPTASSPQLIPGLIELDEVSFADEVVAGVTATKLTFEHPELGLTRSLTWQASPQRLISVGGPGASFGELTDLARSLVETSEAEWRAALPEHRTFANSEPVDD